jgi:phosphoglycerate dehydrogenase-like enzyme
MDGLARLIVPDTYDRDSFLKNVRNAEVIISTWGMPVLDRETLDQAPALKAVFYAAGTVKGWTTPAVWDRNILVTSTASCNAVPVCHYTVSMILLSLKNILPLIRRFPVQGRKAWNPLDYSICGVGNHAVVGIIGASKVGRLVIPELKRLDIQVLVFDPYLMESMAEELGVEKVELNDLLRRSDVISVHAPKTEQTHHMLNAENLHFIKDGATLINTARGDLIDEDALIAELKKGKWTAILDVTEPEPPREDSELYVLPNCFLTPHVAGSMAYECRAMASQAVEELARYVSGKLPLEPVTQHHLRTMA